jgi:UDP-2,3-diacylglucosamine hydrolase
MLAYLSRLYLSSIFHYSTIMRSIFIADAHLRNPEDENYRKLLSFLASLQGTTDALYILGDLFEYWIGYRKIPFAEYAPVVDALESLNKSGTRIIMYEGNHDFHLHPFFTRTVGAKVYHKPSLEVIGGKKVYLCHGDQINDKELGYKVLRGILHGPFIRFVTATVPIEFTAGVARAMSRQSKKNHKQNRTRWDFRGILRAFAARKFASGCDVVIAGHFHTPLMEGNESGDHLLISLGDWVSHFSYGEWSEGRFSLREYP